jgi:hypothetical protein
MLDTIALALLSLKAWPQTDAPRLKDKPVCHSLLAAGDLQRLADIHSAIVSTLQDTTLEQSLSLGASLQHERRIAKFVLNEKYTSPTLKYGMPVRMMAWAGTHRAQCFRTIASHTALSFWRAADSLRVLCVPRYELKSRTYFRSRVDIEADPILLARCQCTAAQSPECGIFDIVAAGFERYPGPRLMTLVISNKRSRIVVRRIIAQTDFRKKVPFAEFVRLDDSPHNLTASKRDVSVVSKIWL